MSEEEIVFYERTEGNWGRKRGKWKGIKNEMSPTSIGSLSFKKFNLVIYLFFVHFSPLFFLKVYLVIYLIFFGSVQSFILFIFV